MTQTEPAAPVADDAATSASFSEADVEQAKRIAGHYFASSMKEHFTAATRDSIRNFAEGYGDDNPLYCDEDYGAGTHWGAQIAPPMIPIAVNQVLLGDRRPPEMRRPSFRGIHVFISGSAWEWFQPVRPGDELYTFDGYESVEEKKSEFAGRSIIITRRHVRMNQRGEVVAISRPIAIHTERKAARKSGKYSAFQPATYTPADIEAIDAIYAAETIRGGEPRYWEDVTVGEELQPRAKGPLTVTDIIVFHSGGYGFTPYKPCTGRIAYRNRQRIGAFYVPDEHGVPDVAQRVHWDTAWAKQVGVPSAYDYGMLRDCWLSHLITDWMGDDGWIVSFSSQLRRFNYLGDNHIVTGEVTGKRIEDGRYLVDISLRGTNQRGEITCPATATVALPSRAAGAVVLPEPPADIAEQARQMLDRHLELRAKR
jgi:acyl dehydratase